MGFASLLSPAAPAQSTRHRLLVGAQLSASPLAVAGESAAGAPVQIAQLDTPHAAAERASKAPTSDAARRQALAALARELRCNAEQCRILRSRLMAQPATRRQVYTITSSVAGEGRTTSCLGLAMSFAELPARRVLIVEADTVCPQLERILRLPPGPGFADWLRGECSRPQATTAVAAGSFCVMRAGRGDENRLAEHIASPTMQQKMAELRADFDHIIIDTPPVSRAAEAGLIGRLSDHVLLLIRSGHTPRHTIDRTLRVLDGFGSRPHMAILTGASS